MSAAIVIYAYGAFMLLGGIMGAVKGSKISLIAGGITGIILLIAGRAVAKGASWGYPTAVVVTGLMLANFAGMYMKGHQTRSAVFAVVSLLFLVAMLMAGRNR